MINKLTDHTIVNLYEGSPLKKSVRIGKTINVDGHELKYLLQFPRMKRGINPRSRYPAILFLHGSTGEKYIDELIVGKHKDGLLQDHIDGSCEFPFYVIGPRIPDGICSWSIVSELVINALDCAIAEYPIDTDRIYLAGFSMGGCGVFDLAVKYPRKFAALAPSAGLTEDLDSLDKIKHIPMWIFYCRNDEIMPYSIGYGIITKMMELNANVILTVYPGKHSLEPTIYAEGTLSWFLMQRKR